VVAAAVRGPTSRLRTLNVVPILLVAPFFFHNGACLLDDGAKERTRSITM
jgi:hypothetical protein